MIFDIEKIKKELENNGYYIHTNTSNENRKKADSICDELSLYFNEINPEHNIHILNQEVPPSCNFGIIYKSDITNGFLKLTHDEDEVLLRQEIKNQIK